MFPLVPSSQSASSSCVIHFAVLTPSGISNYYCYIHLKKSRKIPSISLGKTIVTNLQSEKSCPSRRCPYGQYGATRGVRQGHTRFINVDDKQIATIPI